jgi:uncharacterized protein involved in exopolysaccharide biosynthesis
MMAGEAGAAGGGVAGLAPAAGHVSSMDFRDVLVGIWRRRGSILATALAAAGLAFAYASIASPKYTTDAQVLIENLETPFTRAQPTDTGDRRQIEQLEVSSQVEVLQSRDLAKRVVEELKLVDVPEFNPPTDGMRLHKRILIALGFSIDPRKQTPVQRALSAYFDKVNVYQIPQSKVIVIQASAGDPVVAAEIANATADLYVKGTREFQSESTVKAREWLAEQIEDLRKKVVESEKAVEDFRARAGLLRGGNAVTLSSQELSELNSQIILAESQRSEAQAKAKAIRDMLARTGTVEASGEVLNSPLIQRLREQEVALQRTLAELSTVYLDNHPRIIGAKKELADLNRQVRAEALKVVERLEQEAKIAATREAALRASLDELKARASEINQDEVKLRELEREATANRTLLESFLARFSDASARQQLEAQPGLARVIARADPPSQPTFPKVGPIVAIGLIGGLVLGLGFAFLAEVMAIANRVFGPPSAAIATPFAEPAPRMTPRPRPAVVETVVAPPPGVERPAPPAHAKSPAARLEAAAIWLAQTRRDHGIGRFAVLAHGGAGAAAAKATVSLARHLAARGGKVIVVDASTGGALAALFEVRAKPGLADLVAGRAAFSDVIVRDRRSPAHVMGAGTAEGAAPSPSDGERMRLMLEALDRTYEVVLVHVGELAFSDLAAGGLVASFRGALVFAPQAHGADAAIVLEQLRRLGVAALRLIEVDGADRAHDDRAGLRIAANA